jgi:peptidoglycan/LPS O-acetylase OafA/YrhL
MKHTNNFDLLRLLAALQVVTAHGVGHLQLPVEHPYLYRVIGLFPGVGVFFVISGFLISASAMTTTSYKQFAINRVLRIYPALIVMVIVTLAMLALGNSLRFYPDTGEFWAWLGTTLTIGSDVLSQRFIGNIYVRGGLYPFALTGVLWTIPIELTFYILLPIILLPKKNIGLWLAAWFLASIVYMFAFGQHSIFVGPYLWLFLIGVTMQVYWRHVEKIVTGRGALFLIAYTVAGYVFFILPGSGYTYKTAAIPNVLMTIFLGVTVVSIAYTLPHLSERILRGKDISYGVYIWHMPIIATLMGLQAVGNWLVLPIVYLATLAAASLSSRFIEVPALKQKYRLNALLTPRSLHSEGTEPLPGAGRAAGDAHPADVAAR